MNKNTYLSKLRNLWFDSIRTGTDVLIKTRTGNHRVQVVLKDQYHKRLLVDRGGNQNEWFSITDCIPVPEYMNLEIYKALTEVEDV
jgi:hypothetical protein